MIARLDKLSRNEDIQRLLEGVSWDIIIVDEAHKLSASVFGNKVEKTRRYKLGELLSKTTRHFLLLTATPHNGNEESFKLFMSLVDPDRFTVNSKYSPDASDVMRRLVKEDLLKFDGTPLFPERIATTISYTLTEAEQDLYEKVTKYVREEFNKADAIMNKAKKVAVGFALTSLQRRLASSPEAIYRSLQRRFDKLHKVYVGLKTEAFETQDYAQTFYLEDPDDDFEDMTEDEQEDLENQMDSATAARTKEELHKELQILDGLVADAESLCKNNSDRKWDEVSKLLQDPQMVRADGQREKIIIFTEHKDTLNYLTDKIRTLLGRPEAVVTISGGMTRDKRKKTEAAFKQDKEVSVLIATDAAGEGINLQRAHFMINYDMPWNPNRIEQRFGRIHRIGQMEICHLWNIVAKNTREGDVFKRLFDKLEQERQNLGGKVFDVLGKLTFEDKPLKDILMEAIRYGEDPVHKNRIHQVVDSSLDKERLVALIKEHALSGEIFDQASVIRVKEEMERMKARKLQPYYIEAFFRSALADAKGTLQPREKGRYELKHVPPVLRDSFIGFGYGRQVLPRYERICFEKDAVSLEGKPEADLIAPGHPLLDAAISYVKKRYSSMVAQGSVLVDHSGKSIKSRLLYTVDLAVRDNLSDGNNPNYVARELSFLELDEDGNTYSAGYAPHLDYDICTDSFQKKQALEKNPWIQQDSENKLKVHALTKMLPGMLQKVKNDREALLDRLSHEVQITLTNEANYCFGKAQEFLDKSKKNKKSEQALLNHHREFQERGEMLVRRLEERLSEIEKERTLVPMTPRFLNVALVVPAEQAQEEGFHEPQPSYEGRKAVEIKAMERVMELERLWGFDPIDVSSENRGYDIESRIPLELQVQYGYAIRCIEVKGKSAENASTVTVTHNEILTALNLKKQFILALVAVDQDKTTTVYCTEAFTKAPQDAIASVNFNTAKLLETAIILYDERI